jgi:hypothetical protein
MLKHLLLGLLAAAILTAAIPETDFVVPEITGALLETPDAGSGTPVAPTHGQHDVAIERVLDEFAELNGKHIAEAVRTFGAWVDNTLDKNSGTPKPELVCKLWDAAWSKAKDNLDPGEYEAWTSRMETMMIQKFKCDETPTVVDLLSFSEVQKAAPAKITAELISSSETAHAGQKAKVGLWRRRRRSPRRRRTTLVPHHDGTYYFTWGEDVCDSDSACGSGLKCHSGNCPWGCNGGFFGNCDDCCADQFNGWTISDNLAYATWGQDACDSNDQCPTVNGEKYSCGNANAPWGCNGNILGNCDDVCVRGLYDKDTTTCAKGETVSQDDGQTGRCSQITQKWTQQAHCQEGNKQQGVVNAITVGVAVTTNYLFYQTVGEIGIAMDPVKGIQCYAASCQGLTSPAIGVDLDLTVGFWGKESDIWGDSIAASIGVSIPGTECGVGTAFVFADGPARYIGQVLNIGCGVGASLPVGVSIAACTTTQALLLQDKSSEDNDGTEVDNKFTLVETDADRYQKRTKEYARKSKLGLARSNVIFTEPNVHTKKWFHEYSRNYSSASLIALEYDHWVVSNPEPEDLPDEPPMASFLQGYKAELEL